MRAWLIPSTLLPTIVVGALVLIAALFAVVPSWTIPLLIIGSGAAVFRSPRETPGVVAVTPYSWSA